MTRDPAAAAPNATPADLASSAEIRDLRDRALSEARAAVQEHIRRAEALKQAALASARELLQSEPMATHLLATLERGLTGPEAPAPGAPPPNPLEAMDALLSDRRRSLDDALARFMRDSGAPAPIQTTKPSAGAS